jgi:hypothetical protein
MKNEKSSKHIVVDGNTPALKQAFFGAKNVYNKRWSSTWVDL